MQNAFQNPFHILLKIIGGVYAGWFIVVTTFFVSEIAWVLSYQTTPKIFFFLVLTVTTVVVLCLLVFQLFKTQRFRRLLLIFFLILFTPVVSQIIWSMMAADSYEHIRDVYLLPLAIEVRDELEVDASNILQCAFVGFGDHPCGGFDSYLVYSTETTNEKKMIDLVETYNRLDRILEQLGTTYTICNVIAEPELIIENGMCFAK